MTLITSRAGRTSLVSAAVIALSLALSACAPAGDVATLSDDPTNEATSPDRANLVPEEPDLDGPGIDFTDKNEITAEASILDKYPKLDPSRQIPRNLLATALTYYDSNLSKIKNQKYLSIIDMSLPSTKRRYWIVDMSSGSVFATTVAHGKGSDANHDGYAEKFSNTSGSNATSLGIYVTGATYSGSNGYSLRLDGKSSTNSNARSRAVVVHGASYVQDKEVKQGRSWGCPAVPMAYRTKVIDWIKNGSVMYIGQSAK
ncbi:MAG: murein L,D-transpeptidase catalytic domain family protein [Proteobacteria bacterium]|nr:MAG: murein L,D-transpeptidase catalytic domain family protein [Pseudomonadota bacterium]